MFDVWLGRTFVHCVNVIQHFEQFGLLEVNCLANNIWKCMWIAIWGIWNHINRIVFNSAVVDPIEIFIVAQVKAWEWVSYNPPKSCFSYSNWCINVYACLKSLHWWLLLNVCFDSEVTFLGIPTTTSWKIVVGVTSQHKNHHVCLHTVVTCFVVNMYVWGICLNFVRYAL